MTAIATLATWKHRWQLTWQRLNLSPPPDESFNELIAHYQEAHRHYHTLQHLDECFAVLEEVSPALLHPGEFEFALWSHDVIYDVMRHDNEEQSAEWACSCLRACGASEDTIERVHRFVMATRLHQSSEDQDTNALVDLDLSILGAAPERFSQYDAQIRVEYQHVPDSIFYPRRRQILSDFLNRSRIYNTEIFYQRFEKQARHNLTLAYASSHCANGGTAIG